METGPDFCLEPASGTLDKRFVTPDATQSQCTITVLQGASKNKTRRIQTYHTTVKLKKKKKFIFSTNLIKIVLPVKSLTPDLSQ